MRTLRHLILALALFSYSDVLKPSPYGLIPYKNKKEEHYKQVEAWKI